VNYVTAYRGYFTGQLAKYVPGGIWIVPARVLVLRQVGVSMVSSTVGIVVEMCALLGSGVLLSLPYWLIDGAGLTSPTWLLSGLVLTAILLGLHPRVFNPTIRWLCNLVGHTDEATDMSLRQISIILLVDIGFWLTAGTGLFLLVRSVQTVPLRLWLTLVSALSMSWVTGFLAFVTPAGLGVREGTLALLLTPFLPPPLPAGVALLSRLWWTVAELGSIGFATVAMRTTQSGADDSRRHDRLGDGA
jgi:uncharacterized membrane protein YbhN (UPF0104 family)